MRDSAIVIMNPSRRRVALLVLKHRLKLELDCPHFSTGTTARHTMKCARQWGFTGKTRKQALTWAIKEFNNA